MMQVILTYFILQIPVPTCPARRTSIVFWIRTLSRTASSATRRRVPSARGLRCAAGTGGPTAASVTWSGGHAPWAELLRSPTPARANVMLLYNILTVK